ncbi:MAG: glycosyltransferase family 39 protein [Chloroflexi bacterium]|nr:glycosyltransferase family 39 protein [Chloroflexota bacterium]
MSAAATLRQAQGSRTLAPIHWLLAAFVCLGLVYDTATPIFEAGDEQFHYPYVRQIATGNGLPLQDPDDVQAWRQEGSQPPLYYMLAALLTFWVDTGDAAERLTVNPHAIIGVPAYGSSDNRNMMVHTAAEAFPYSRTALAVHLIRWLSLAMATVTVWAVYRLARRIAPSEPVALLAAAFVAFNPMIGFLAGAVNNDNLVILLSTLALWQMVRLWQDGLTRRGVLLLGVVLGLDALTKLNALGLAGVAGLLVLARVVLDARAAKRDFPWREGLIAGLLLSLPVGVIAGWWYARNVMLYGDPTGLNRMLAIVGTRQGTPALLPLLRAELEGMRLSFWGLFGGVNILSAAWQYGVFDLLLAVGCIGIILLIVRHLALRRSVRGLSRAVTAFGWLSAWAVVLVVSWTRWTLVTPATQGRLIFPALATIALVLALGFDACLIYVTNLAHRRSPFAPDADLRGLNTRARSAYALTIVLGVLSLRTALLDIAPAYTAAPLASAVPAAFARPPVRFGDALELIGVEPPPAAARPGDTIDVALYWRAIDPMSADYSVFVHLLDAGDLIVGQRDTYPGLGLRPTTQLKPGDIVRDAYRIKVDESALAPSRPAIRVGVYDFATQKRLASAQGDNPVVGVIDLLARAESGAPAPVTFRFEQFFTLTGYRIDRVAVRPGESFTLTLYWRAGSVPKDYSIFVHVLGKQDAIWGQVDRQLPMRAWRAGDVIEDAYVVTVKPDTPADVYELEIGAYDLENNFKRLNIWGADGQLAGDRVFLRRLRVVR